MKRLAFLCLHLRFHKTASNVFLGFKCDIGLCTKLLNSCCLHNAQQPNTATETSSEVGIEKAHFCTFFKQTSLKNYFKHLFCAQSRGVKSHYLYRSKPPSLPLSLWLSLSLSL